MTMNLKVAPIGASALAEQFARTGRINPVDSVEIVLTATAQSTDASGELLHILAQHRFTRGGYQMFEVAVRDRAALDARLFTVADYARALGLHAETVETLRTSITALERKISKIERDQESKHTRVHELIKQLGDKGKKLKKASTVKRAAAIASGVAPLIAGPFLGRRFRIIVGVFGAASAVGLGGSAHVDAGKADEVEENTRELAGDARGMAARLAGYRELKARLASELQSLEQAGPVSEKPTFKPEPTASAQLFRLNVAAMRLSQVEAETVVLRGRLENLTELNEMARSIGVGLGNLVKQAAEGVKEVEAEIAQATTDVFEVAAALIGGSPVAAATAWLERAVDDDVATVLRVVGARADDLVSWLLGRLPSGTRIDAAKLERSVTYVLAQAATARAGETTRPLGNGFDNLAG